MKIDRIQIKNFKSLKDIDIKLSNLTLITGVNSSGKSTFIQALLLLKQNEDKFYIQNKRTLSINDEYIKLGKKQDILYEEAYKENIEIALYSEKGSTNVIFNNENLKINLKVDNNEINNFNLFDDRFQYIMTDRAIPSISYALSDDNIDRNLIGFRGEYTAHYLAKNQKQELNIQALRHKNSISIELLENVSLWLGYISNGIVISTEIYQGLEVKLTYSYKYGSKETNKYTPINVGFGVTYVLPIIVAILKAKKGDLVIIENPESHLHPAGQSKVAELCAIASANGVQIIVETHSDHFLNGIRVATKKGLLTPEQSKVYYFRKEKDELETKIDEINIDKEGGKDSYPKGFFDQFDDDLDELLGL
jgi:predicted ATPase